MITRPRDFVVQVLKAVFRLNETQALNVMMTAHRKGVCVVAVFARDIAETQGARGDGSRRGERLSAAVRNRARGMSEFVDAEARKLRPDARSSVDVSA